jgi:hypothetical protein
MYARTLCDLFYRPFLLDVKHAKKKIRFRREWRPNGTEIQHLISKGDEVITGPEIQPASGGSPSPKNTNGDLALEKGVSVNTYCTRVGNLLKIISQH